MQESKSQYTQISKKDGNLITRDFVDILKEPIATGKDFVNTSYIQTFILVVQKSQIEILKQNYIFLSENIIPDSLHQFNYEDKDGYTLWSIKLLKIPLNMNQDKNPIEEFVKNMKDKLKYLIIFIIIIIFISIESMFVNLILLLGSRKKNQFK